MQLKEKIEIIINEMNGKLIEREKVIPIILLTIFSKQHMLLLGPPGVAKTHAIELISEFAKELKYFEYLITNGTTLDELFGSKVTTPDGTIAYNIDHSMLDSHLVFVDELYKAPSHLINSLLGVTHTSRSYFQRGRGKMSSPMISMFAASNELPENDAAIAFEDRILFKFWVDDIKELENIKRFAKRDFDRSKEFSVSISLDEMSDVSAKSKDVHIHDNFVAIFADIKVRLATEKISLSGRKLQTSLDIFQTSAYLNGRDFINLSELFLLVDIAWRHFDEIDRVKRVIFDVIFGNPSNVKEVLKKNQIFCKTILSELRSTNGNVLKYNHNFYGSNAEEEFLIARNKLVEINESLDSVNTNCKSLKDNYTYALDMEKQIANNIFLPSYKNHIYMDADVIGEKRISKQEIFELSDTVSRLLRNVTAWLDKAPTLYDYNNIKLSNKIS